jgi:hypothetical protein
MWNNINRIPRHPEVWGSNKAPYSYSRGAWVSPGHRLSSVLVFVVLLNLPTQMLWHHFDYAKTDLFRIPSNLSLHAIHIVLILTSSWSNPQGLLKQLPRQTTPRLSVSFSLKDFPFIPKQRGSLRWEVSSITFILLCYMASDITISGRRIRREKKLNGIVRGLVELVSLHLPGGREENHRHSSGHPVSWQIFEKGTSQLQA